MLFYYIHIQRVALNELLKYLWGERVLKTKVRYVSANLMILLKFLELYKSVQTYKRFI